MKKQLRGRRPRHWYNYGSLYSAAEKPQNGGWLTRAALDCPVRIGPNGICGIDRTNRIATHLLLSIDCDDVNWFSRHTELHTATSRSIVSSCSFNYIAIQCMNADSPSGNTDRRRSSIDLIVFWRGTVTQWQLLPAWRHLAAADQEHQLWRTSLQSFVFWSTTTQQERWGCMT